MEEKKLLGGLVVTAVIGILLCVVGVSLPVAFTTLLAFPFEQIGIFLRWLSLGSSIGNVIAIIIYCLISLAPILLYIVLYQRKKNETIDIMLVLLSVALFVGLYLMINPSEIGKLYNNSDFIVIGKSMIGMTIYSIIFGYIIFRLLKKVENSKTDSMLSVLKTLLRITAYIFVINIFWISLMGLIKGMDSLVLANVGTEDELLISKVFLILQYLVSVMPYFFNLLIIITSLKIINSIKGNPFTEEVSLCASKTVELCKISIILVIISQIALNIIQLTLGASIRNSNYTLNIPIFSVIFVLVTMLISKYFEQAREIKNDNDMII